jgi:predicted metalloprotease with PDZ domain
MDLRRFEFDFDLTWYVFFLNADETVYGRYGGRDAADAEARLSLKGLRYAMGRALKAHQTPPSAQRLTGRPQRAEDFRASRRHEGCIHCHNVNEFRRTDSKAAGKWNRDSVWVYPLPENVGITLDVDVGDRVKAVAANSPAGRAGMKPGDRLAKLNGYPVASFADATYALHQAPRKGAVSVSWVRADKEQAATLALPEGWRKTNLTWRPSMLDILPSLPFAGEDLTAEEKKQLGLPESRAAFRQSDGVHSTLADAGLRAGDVVVGFNGVAVTGTMGDLLAYARRNYLVEDTVTVDIFRGGKRVGVRLVLK